MSESQLTQVISKINAKLEDKCHKCKHPNDVHIDDDSIDYTKREKWCTWENPELCDCYEIIKKEAS